MKSGCSIVPAVAVVSLSLHGCGIAVPQIGEAWESVAVTSDMEYRIKANIYCELLGALDYARATYRIGGISGVPAIPDDYGVQVQISLTVDETSALNAGATYNETLRNAAVHAINVPQMFTLSAGGTLSSTATRVDTSYTYYNVGKLANRHGFKTFCETDPPDLSGSSPLLRSDLGIKDYLSAALKGAAVLHSSTPAKGGAGKSAKLDVYSYEIKFLIVSNGSVTPTWKLVNITSGFGNLPWVSTGRTRTHDLILTFGPGVDKPTDFALQTHFTGQIVQSNQMRPPAQSPGF